MAETAATTGTMKNDGDDDSKRSSGMTSNGDSNKMEINSSPPPDQADATIDDNIEETKPPGDAYHEEEKEGLEDGHYNYCTRHRVHHRLSLWKEYQENTLETKDFPDRKQYLFSSKPSTEVEQLIWGHDNDDERSLKYFCKSLKDLQATSNDLKKDDSYPCARIDHVSSLIKDRETRIRDLEADIELVLKIMLTRHEIQWLALTQLSDVPEKWNVVIESDTSSASESDISIPSLEGDRVAKSRRYEPLPSTVEGIRNAKPNQNFLHELLQKKEILCHQEHLLELQSFVAAIMEKAHVARTKLDKKIKAFVDVILEWKPGMTVESLGRLKGRFACPPSTACETMADQPILCALIFRILSILRQGTVSESSEQVAVPIGTEGHDRTMDSIHEEYREFLRVTSHLGI